MSTYSNLADAFNSGDLAELDRMADDINNSKKKKLAKSIQNDITDTYRESQKTVNGLERSPINQYYPQSNQEFKYFSTQGDFTSGDQNEYMGTFLSDIKKSQENNGSTLSDHSDTDLHTFNNSINNTTLPSLDDNDKDRVVHNKHKKQNYYKKIKDLADSIKSMHHDDSSSASSDSMEDTIDHLKECNKCRKKLSLMLKGKKDNNNNNHLFTDRVNTIEQPPIVQQIVQPQSQYNGLFSFLTKSDYRDILLLILIIVLIVLIVDMVMHRK